MMFRLFGNLPNSGIQNVQNAHTSITDFLTPRLGTLLEIATLLAAAVLAFAGYSYMTSAGDPNKLERSKKWIRNAIIGLVLVAAAGFVVTLLTNAYTHSAGSFSQGLPKLEPIKQADGPGGVEDLLVKGITGLLLNIIVSVGQPVVDSLNFFISNTPTMANITAVFNLWAVVLAIAVPLAALAVALIGFHVIGADVFGFEEDDLRQLLPRIALGMLMMFTSIFIVDALIGLASAIVVAIQNGAGSTYLWKALTDIVRDQTAGMSVAGLLLVMVFLIIAVMLLVYYLKRMVVLILGAVASPLVVLLWLVPSFRGFANSLIRSYIMTVFIVVVHAITMAVAGVVILGTNDPLMSIALGCAALLTMYKSQSVIEQRAEIGFAARSTQKAATQVANGLGHMSRKVGAGVDKYAGNKINHARGQYVLNTMGRKGSNG